MNNDIKFGANYVPPESWFYSWVDFNENKVKEDFCALKEIGLDHLRVFIRWDLFQPATSYVPESMLKRVGKVLKAAEEVGLEIYLSVFTGWMSGLWFLPAFTRPKEKNINIITDNVMIKAEKFLLKKISEVANKFNSFAGIDLGNELNVYDLFLGKFTIEEGDAWLSDMVSYSERLFLGKTVTIGVDHNPWFGDCQFSRETLANVGTVTSLHTWTKFTGAINYGAESVENLHLAEYNAELVKAYAKAPDRKVWIQEFGVIPEWMKEEQFENFIKSTMKNAVRSGNIWGFTIWCSHEFDNKYVDVDDWETKFGILTKDNKLKPLGKIYKEAIEEIKKTEQVSEKENKLKIYIDKNKSFNGLNYLEKFADAAKNGKSVQFVLR